jgi:hypothetical protein
LFIGLRCRTAGGYAGKKLLFGEHIDMKSRLLPCLLGLFLASTAVPDAISSSSNTEISGQWHRTNLPAIAESEKPSKPDMTDPDWIFLARPRADIKFDADVWRKTSERARLLSVFAHDYPVIGMEKPTVRTLLGEPVKPLSGFKNDVYLVTAQSSCIVGKRNSQNSSTFFELSYENDKVNGFRTFITKGK